MVPHLAGTKVGARTGLIATSVTVLLDGLGTTARRTEMIVAVAHADMVQLAQIELMHIRALV